MASCETWNCVNPAAPSILTWLTCTDVGKMSGMNSMEVPCTTVLVNRNFHWMGMQNGTPGIETHQRHFAFQGGHHLHLQWSWNGKLICMDIAVPESPLCWAMRSSPL